ncbi:hypothetical protein [Winogradskyella vincentii]|uniref:Protein required for attachment to host cells n=1 Tax=Winogradskyella vincentii TaxID=2877122 RepID=A0ABS7Y2H2_9FLAO|nr:hypothetical protein [Winogradskyella vincentii]MCA0154121.1 hypothetical protein [Winogradskyella vincentii]
MKNKGIWIDKEKAHIVTVLEKDTKMVTILAEDNVEQSFEVERPGGAQEIIKDRKVLEREKLRINSFIKSLVPKLKDTKNILVLGPSMMCQKFAKVLGNNYPIIGAKIKEVRKADKMTENQLKALVKDYFSPLG